MDPGPKTSSGQIPTAFLFFFSRDGRHHQSITALPNTGVIFGESFNMVPSSPYQSIEDLIFLSSLPQALLSG